MTSRTSVAPPGPLSLTKYPVSREMLPTRRMDAGCYTLRFARDTHELDRILRLRFEVFNLELGEGLEASYASGRDDDGLDARFHHLYIEEHATGAVVGTYRMQTGQMAERNGGFYTAGEFDLSNLPPTLVDRAVEIGRACVVREHRNGRVLHLLWRGLADYLAWNRKSALFGCCSLTSQDPGLAISTHAHLLREGHVHPHIRIDPLPEARCVPTGDPLPQPHVPALFRSYLGLGARVCGPPALDPAFRTIDWFVLLETGDLHPRTYRSFFG